MRYGEVATPTVTQSSAVTPQPTIGDVHNNEDSTSNVVFNESSEQIQSTSVRPNATYSFNTNPTRHQAAMFSQYAYGNVKVDERSNDWTDFRIPQRLGENPDAFTQSETFKLQNLTMPRLFGSKNSNTKLQAPIDSVKENNMLPVSTEYHKITPELAKVLGIKLPEGSDGIVVSTLPSGATVTLSEAVQRYNKVA